VALTSSVIELNHQPSLFETEKRVLWSRIFIVENT
jgi:hypothetical protein